MDPAENEKKKPKAKELQRMAKEMSEALIRNPRLMDELSARLPTEFSFVLRQLPHDQEAMETFVTAILPLLEKEKRLAKLMNEGDKIDLFLDLMDKPEFINWVVLAITGKDANQVLESGTPGWLSKSQQGADLLEQRRFDESKQLLLEALEECDRERPNSLWSFAILRALAVACGGAGDVDRLEPLLKRWIDAAESKLGSWHPELAYPYSMMALVREESGNIEAAEELYKKAVAILERSELPDEDDLNNAIHELGFFYFRQERFAEARPLLSRVLKSLEDSNQPEEGKLEYLEALAVSDAEEGRFAEMEAYARRILSFCESNPGEFEDSWYPMGLLACSFLAQGKADAASVAFETVLEKMKNTSIEDNEKLSLVLDSYIDLLKKSGREREAMLVSSQSQRIVFQHFEIRTETDEVISDELPIEIVALCFYRLAEIDAADTWQFMDSDEKSKKLREILVSCLQEFFASTDFLKICTDFKEIEEEFQDILANNAELRGLEIVFQFREFSDKGGFLQVLGKLQRAIQLSSSGKNQEAEELFEESLEESVRFTRSDLKRYVKEIFLDHLVNSGQEERANELRDREI